MTSIIEERMKVLARVKGRWRGTYLEQTPDGMEVDRYDFFLDISFPDEPGAAYRQVTRYRWPDGRQVEHVFDAGFVETNGIPAVTWDHEIMSGRMFEIDDSTIQLRFSYKGAEQIQVQESMFVSPTGAHRMRTWHWFKGGEPYRKTIVQEHRVLEQ